MEQPLPHPHAQVGDRQAHEEEVTPVNSTTLLRTVGTAPSCPPVTVLPHAVAHATLPATYAGIPAVRDERFRPAGAATRTGGQVSRPVDRTAAISMITGPIFDDHKCTGASVPGRRGGT